VGHDGIMPIEGNKPVKVLIKMKEHIIHSALMHYFCMNFSALVRSELVALETNAL
jgi:hypothetical protein